MINILYIGAFRFPNGDAAAARVLNNGKLLRKMGYNVKFLSFGKSKFYDYLPNVDTYNGFKFEITKDIDLAQNNLFKRFNSFIFNGQNSLKSIKKSIDTFDVIIAYNPSLFLNYSLQKLSKKHQKKYCIDLTEWYQFNEFPGGKFLPFAWMNELNMKVVHKNSKFKILISSYLDKYYKNSNNIILPPLIDYEDQKWNHRDKSLEEFNGIRIIYAGNPSNKDSLDIIIQSVLEVVKMGYSLQLIILGINKSEYIINEDITCFTTNIKFLGKVNQDLVPSYYNSSDFSIILRKNTRKNNSGFPTKFVESLMASCPVITNLVSDIDQYIIDNENGFIVKNISIDGLVPVFCKLFAISDLDNLKINARNIAIEKFDYRNYIESMNNFI